MPLFLNLRIDTHLVRRESPEGRFRDTIVRARSYVEAGADGIFVPGVPGTLSSETIAALASEIPAPLNLIAGPDKSPATFAQLAVGVQVSVTGRNSAGKLVADSIRILEAAGRVEIRGQLTAVAAGSIKLKALDTPFVIKTDAKTEVVGTLAAGTSASVTATLQTDGSLLANRIVVQSGNDGTKGSETGFYGVVEKIDTAAGLIVASGATIRISSASAIRSGETQIRLSDLKVGDKVKVAGTKQADGSVKAARIEVLTAKP